MKERDTRTLFKGRGDQYNKCGKNKYNLKS